MSGVYLNKSFNAAHHNVKIKLSPPFLSNFERSKMLQETIHCSQHEDEKREETNNDHTNILKLNDDHRIDRNVSACIEVPNAARRSRRTSEEPTMTDLMAAMVLNNLSCSPVLCSHLAGSSPRSYDSSGVGSWSQDSRHASPFHLIGSSKIPPSSKQDFDSEVTFDQKSPLRRSRSRNDISDMDPGTILLQGSTPTPREEEENSEDADTDQPKDFSMKTLLAKEEEESQKKSSLSRSERVDAKDNLTEQESNNIFFNVGNCTFPNVSKSNCILIPPQISIPYYFPPPLVPNPFHASLPNDFLLHLAGTPPSSLPNADPLGSSAPGHIDGRIQRFSRRAAPYYKVNDDSLLSSPRHSTSPLSFTFGSRPDSYRFSNSLMVPGSNFSLSPTRYRKATRSPVTSKPPTSPYSSPSRGPPTTPHLTLPTDISGFQSTHDHPPSERSKSNYVQNHVPLWNKRSNHPHVMSKSFSQGHHQSNLHSKTPTAVVAESIPVPIGRKVPGDGKKCRKVYGMENRDIWCTSCRWKKACQRFPD